MGVVGGWRRGLVMAGALGAACAQSPTPPSPTPTPAAATITITTAGANPKTVQIGLGQRVLFINNDTRVHEMDSDPHPDHTDCPEINQVDLLTPGQTKLTGNLNTRRTCGFHDHLNDTNNSLRGSIVIQ